MFNDFKHLKDVCMTYMEHMEHSHSLSYLFLKASFKAFVHGLIPSAFVTSSTDTLAYANELMSNSGCRDNIESEGENSLINDVTLSSYRDRAGTMFVDTDIN